MPRKRPPNLPKHIKAIGRIEKVECEAICPVCKTTSSTMIGSIDCELNYTHCYYESDRPSSTIQATFWCDPCDATFIANLEGYEL